MKNVLQKTYFKNVLKDRFIDPCIICHVLNHLILTFFKLAELPKVLYPFTPYSCFTWVLKFLPKVLRFLPSSNYGKLKHEHKAKRKTIKKITTKQLACFSITNVTFFTHSLRNGFLLIFYHLGAVH